MEEQQRQAARVTHTLAVEAGISDLGRVLEQGETARRGSAIRPGVWPKAKNRMRRRASASLAFTGRCS